MKDYIKEQIANVKDTNLARCILREYLQARILESFQGSGAFTNWAFVGGTSLRFLYGMPRFSEDLDFSLKTAGIEDNFKALLKKAIKVFEDENYNVLAKIKELKNVKSSFIKFSDLLYEMGLSPHPAETVSIKIEIDVNPPEGARFETTIVRRHVILNLLHYDKSSLFAGKLHAFLSRKFVKGRDIYDLFWYLSEKGWPGPNLVLLNNALKQTHWTGPQMTEKNWRNEIAQKVRILDWVKVIGDVKPFIEKTSDIDLLTKENILSLLKH